MDWARLDLGVGIIALGALDHVWSGIEDLVDVVEVEPQTLWPSRVRGGQHLSPEPLAWLRSLWTAPHLSRRRLSRRRHDPA